MSEIVVTLLTLHGGYNPGENAAFTEEKGNALIAAGLAALNVERTAEHQAWLARGGIAQHHQDFKAPEADGPLEIVEAKDVPAEPAKAEPTPPIALKELAPAPSAVEPAAVEAK